MYFEAVFQPLNDTDYNCEVADFLGKKVAIQEGWILEEGPCKGQKCFYMPKSTVGCIPERDLKQIKSIPYIQWKTVYSLTGLSDPILDPISKMHLPLNSCVTDLLKMLT